jgi:glycosyltransferase involved in cell wall biosynthesis
MVGYYKALFRVINLKRLTIISHTKHYKNIDGAIVGWGATVTEINHLLDVFDRITHIAMLQTEPAPPSALRYTSDKIDFVAIPAVGGPKLLDKLSIITTAPRIIRSIQKALKNSDYFQFRAPTGIGVFVIPYLIFFNNSKGWFKYAGNWKQENAPIAYRFQKWLLEHQSRKVTINGFWKNQPTHCLSFENPCLTQDEVDQGQVYGQEKRDYSFINFCFVGRLETAKGIDLLFDALSNLNEQYLSKIGTIHLVGDGVQMESYKNRVKTVNIKFIFHGFLSRKEVHKVYMDSHAIVLPSASEGFPKVIAEAMNYGCIPIVSDISSIGHYIKGGVNGFLLKEITAKELKMSLEFFLTLTANQYQQIRFSNPDFIKSFTYNYYNKRLFEEIL